MQAEKTSILKKKLKMRQLGIVKSTVARNDDIIAQLSEKIPTYNAGAHEPPKAVKEHATRFHDNPNYVMHFQKFSDFF